VKDQTSTAHQWVASDYRPESHGPGREDRSRLNHPKTTNDEFPSFMLLAGLFWLGELPHDCATMVPLQFVLAAMDLQRAGWPVVIKHGPLRLCWRDEVPPDVVQAWRESFGTRGMEDVRRHLEPISQYRRLDKAAVFTGHPSR